MELPATASGVARNSLVDEGHLEACRSIGGGCSRDTRQIVVVHRGNSGRERIGLRSVYGKHAALRTAKPVTLPISALPPWLMTTECPSVTRSDSPEMTTAPSV